MSKKKSTNIKITSDYVIDEYLKAKELKGMKKKEAMARIKYLSLNLGKFLPSE
jgi:hypothetical protein